MRSFIGSVAAVLAGGVLAGGAAAVGGAGGVAAAGGQGAPPTAPPGGPGARAASASMPPESLLGRRAEAQRRRVPVASVLVIVPDERSFLAAAEQWTAGPAPARGAGPGGELAGVRFPILIDDGTRSAAENIARFSRAFGPSRTLLWSAPAASPPLPADAAGIVALYRRVHASAWGVAPPAAPGGAGGPPAAPAQAVSDALRARWNELGHSPPGVVAFVPGDPARAGALALAALRGQVLAPLEAGALPADGTAPIPLSRLLAVDKKLRSACTLSGYSFEALGDQLDAVTLASNCSPRVMIDPADAVRLSPRGPAPFAPDPAKPEPLAVTDLLGRDLPSAVERRWAWAGQLTGTAASSVYRAMSAFFLTPDSAAAFDGYEDADPFRRWSPVAAGRILAAPDGGNGWTLADLSAKGRSLHAWRAATHSGLDAALLMVTTSGQQSTFDLSPGQGQVGDVPLLARPTAVYFVHSFSAAQPANRWTIAGRFLDRGAVLYIGSVHEPFLQAFVPTPALVQRALGGAPLGAACRFTDGPPWRVAVLGDPLVTITRRPAGAAPGAHAGPDRLPAAIESSATDLAQRVRDDLKAKRYAPAVAGLGLMARDADAARVVKALLADEAASVTPEVAAAAVMPLFRAGEPAALVRCAALCIETLPDAAQWELTDALWHMVGPRSRRPMAEAEAALLARRPRTDTGELLARDLDELARAMAQDLTPARARALLTAARDAAPADRRPAYDRALLAVAPK